MKPNDEEGNENAFNREYGDPEAALRNYLDQMGIPQTFLVRDVAQYHAACIGAGLPENVAEKMAVQYHQVLMTGITLGIINGAGSQ